MHLIFFKAEFSKDMGKKKKSQSDGSILQALKYKAVKTMEM